MDACNFSLAARRQGARLDQWMARAKHVHRRELITLLGGAPPWPFAPHAQKAPVRLGFLASGAAGSANSAAQIDGIKQGLRDKSLIEGHDYILDARFAAGNHERFPEVAS